MARVIVFLRERPLGLMVECKVEPESGDSELARRTAEKVAATLVGYVLAKVEATAKKSKSHKEKTNVH